jgi:flagellar hook capping protein FlgD
MPIKVQAVLWTVLLLPTLFEDGSTQVLPPRETPVLSIGPQFEDFDKPTAGNGAPPDADCAAGSYYVVNLGNYLISWHKKDGTENNQTSLRDFFLELDPIGTITDPMVEHDDAGRFIITALHRSQYIYIAISTGEDPSGQWEKWSIDTHRSIDQPQLAIGPTAIFITTHEGYVFILDKEAAYNDPPILQYSFHQPSLELGAPILSYQPAIIHGVPPAGIGGFLIGYQNPTNGHEFVTIIEIKDGEHSPQFNPFQTIDVGDIDLDQAERGAFQSNGSGLGDVRLQTSARRCQRAVWRNGKLWATVDVLTGTPENNEISVHWWCFRALGDNSFAWLQQGDIGGEDISAAADVFYPTIDVDSDENALLGFCLSGPNIFAGCYFAVKKRDQEAFQPVEVLAEGEAYYSLGCPFPGFCESRWGDYSGISLDPNGRTFWLFNMYTKPNNVWGTRWCNASVKRDPTDVVLSYFRSSSMNGAVFLKWATSTESYVSGVYVQRSTDPDGNYERLNTEIIGPGAASFEDMRVTPGITYYYRLEALDRTGTRTFFGPLSVRIEPRGLGPTLGQAFPNPFRGSAVTIPFTLAKAANVKFRILDFFGRQVRMLMDEEKGEGDLSVTWNGRDERGNAVPAGIYVYQLQTPGFEASRRLVRLQ